MSDLIDLIDQEFGIRQRFGNEVVIECPDPDHSDDHPSAWVNTEKGLWVCYSCGSGGKVEDILPSGVRVNRDITMEQLEEALEGLNHKQESYGYPEAWLRRFTIWDERYDYWEGERGLTRDTIERFDLGWDPEERAATYPLRDAVGRVLGVVRRFTRGGGPKYKYPRHAPIHLNLFGYHHLGANHPVVLVEGAMDALAWWDVGYPSVAQYGGQLSEHQIGLLIASGVPEVICCFDNDRQGRECLDAVMDSRLAESVMVSTVTWDGIYAKYKDPADLPRDLREKMWHGRVSRLDYLL